MVYAVHDDGSTITMLLEVVYTGQIQGWLHLQRLCCIAFRV